MIYWNDLLHFQSLFQTTRNSVQFQSKESHPVYNESQVLEAEEAAPP